MSNIPSLDQMLKLYTKKELWERIQHHIERADDLQSQLAHQKEMWNELKEYISNQIIHYDKLSDIFRDEKNDGCALLSLTKKQVVERILYKIQELEKGEKDE